jgi:hypothetical protein
LKKQDGIFFGYSGLICASDFGVCVPVISAQTVPLFTNLKNVSIDNINYTIIPVVSLSRKLIVGFRITSTPKEMM